MKLTDAQLLELVTQGKNVVPNMATNELLVFLADDLRDARSILREVLQRQADFTKGTAITRAIRYMGAVDGA